MGRLHWKDQIKYRYAFAFDNKNRNNPENNDSTTIYHLDDCYYNGKLVYNYDEG